MNNVESNTDSDSSNEVFNINNNNKRNNIIDNNNSNSENRNINISESENNSVVTNSVMDRPIGYTCVNISNFLNNVCVNIYVMWYLIIKFPFWCKRCQYYWFKL